MINLLAELKHDISASTIDMVYSGFVIGVIIFALFLFTAIQGERDLKQVRRFKDKTTNIYYNNNSLWTIRAMEICSLVFFVISLGLFIAFLSINNVLDNKSISKWLVILFFYISFLLNVVFEILYLGFANYWSSSIIVVVDQDNLVTVNEIINKKQIRFVDTDSKRHFYRITYSDLSVKGNVKLVKIRYNYKLKDFLTNNGFLTKEINHD